METTRRGFLRAGALAALGLARPFDLLGPRPAHAGARQDPIVVTISLLGGNDALNTLVPLRQFGRYRALRPSLAWGRGRLLRLAGYEEEFGLCPGMDALAALFADGKVALINGCGCPPSADGLFDHEASMRNFWTGETYGATPPGQPTGWLGRFLDRLPPSAFPAAIDLGNTPLVLTGERVQPLSLAGLSGFGVFPSTEAAARAAAYRRIQAAPLAGGVAERGRRLRTRILALGGELQTIADAYAAAPGIVYPAVPFAWALQDCAALITARRGVRALSVALPGFDTHALQNLGVPETTPYHQSLLAMLSDAVAAFYADLRAHGASEPVVIVIVSEFGRRCAENADIGTDHGFGGLMIVVGDRVRGGIYGDHPDLRDEYLALDGNLDVLIDFRSVYATILARHLGADPEPILKGRFAEVEFL